MLRGHGCPKSISLTLMLKHITLLLFALCGLGCKAQMVHPITRFHATDSPYTTYRNNFLSGFMQLAPQAAAKDSLNGFLQVPILGRPVWVYVGEKDSTQFMAYASSYRDLKLTADSISVMLTRYGIQAKLEERGGVLVQHYAYPDTTAEKAFLLDVDHVLGGASNEDMDIKMVDRRNIRAYKRGYDSQDPQLYYYAHFSHPYESYNIRRERVTLDNGQKESRVKAVFSFLLKDGEELTVTSAVSERNADEAYALVEGHRPAQSFKDQRKPRPQEERPALADNRTNHPQVATASVSAAREQSTSTRTANAASQPQRTSASQRQPRNSSVPSRVKSSALPDHIVVETREAPLRAAFYTALDRLLQLPSFRNVRTANEFLDKVQILASASPLSSEENNPAQTDSILRQFAAGCMSGESMKDDNNGHMAAAFILESMGLRPVSAQASHAEGNDKAYILQRPLFNVVTIYFPFDRRFILHTKSNSPANMKVLNASWNGTKLTIPATITHSTLLKGGVMTVKMGK